MLKKKQLNLTNKKEYSSSIEVVPGPKQYDQLLKFVTLGESDSHITTIGVDFKIRTIIVDGERVRVQIWDTAGQERFRTIAATYYRNSHGVIIVFDITNRESFEKIKVWLEEVKKYCMDIPKILVGNKCDDYNRRLIQQIEAQKVADELEMPYFETSAKDNLNIEQMFISLIRLVLDNKREREINRKTSKDRISLSSRHSIKTKKPCC